MTEQLALTLIAATVGFVAAIFFCIGNAFNSVEKITLQSTQFWDFSEPVARALASQRAQYVTGGLLLLTSFVLQVAAALASSTNPATLPQFLVFWQYLVLAALLPTSAVSWFFCGYLDKATINKVLKKHQEKLESSE
jgi:hypothetical protein